MEVYVCSSGYWLVFWMSGDLDCEEEKEPDVLTPTHEQLHQKNSSQSLPGMTQSVLIQWSLYNHNIMHVKTSDYIYYLLSFKPSLLSWQVLGEIFSDRLVQIKVISIWTQLFFKQNLPSNCLPGEEFTGKCRIMKYLEIYRHNRTTLHYQALPFRQQL